MLILPKHEQELTMHTHLSTCYWKPKENKLFSVLTFESLFQAVAAAAAATWGIIIFFILLKM